MTLKKLIALTIVLGLPCLAVRAESNKLQLCAKANGTILAKSKCSKSETRVSVSGLGLRYADCTYRNECFSGTSPLEVTSSCQSGEFLITHGFFGGGDDTVIRSIYLRNDPVTAAYPVGVTYRFTKDGGGSLGQMCLDLFCCKQTNGLAD